MAQTNDLALLKAKLQVPLAVHDILSGADRMSDEACYSFHAAIGDMKPHEALLAIALSTRVLTSYCSPQENIVRAIRASCDFMISQHADFYLRGDESTFAAGLPAVMEDLQRLCTQLKTLGLYLADKNTLGVIFCDILAVQANAQKVIAGAFLELFEIPAAEQDNMHILLASSPRFEGKRPH